MIIQLQPFQNVVASGIATTDLRHLLGQTLENITLRLGGTTFTKSMITLIQLKGGGKVLWESTGARTDARSLWRGGVASASYLEIDFTEKKARTLAAYMAGGFDTSYGAVRDLRLEVTISGATAPTLDGFCECSAPDLSPQAAGYRPLIARVHSFTQSIGAAGTFALNVPHLDPGAGGSIFKRIAIFGSLVTGARVERNGVREWEHISAGANLFNANQYGRVNSAGLFMIDFVTAGVVQGEALDTRPAANCLSAAVYATFSGAETVTVEAEVLEPAAAY